MGTPKTSPGTPLPELVACEWCQTTIEDFFLKKEASCSSGHNVCTQCQDIYCPLCNEQLQLVVPETYTYNLFTAQQEIVGTFFKLHVEFIGGLLCDLRVLNSQRNCRLHCTWGDEIFSILLYRNRKPYSCLPNFLSRQINFLFQVKVVPANLVLPIPKLISTPCSWRILIEMYPMFLDRPEIAKLNLLPDTPLHFLESYFFTALQNVQLWQFQHPFSKYDCFFFASDEQGLYCLQCGGAKTSISELKKCLGGPAIVSDHAILNAAPISVFFQDKQLCKIIDTRCRFKTFTDFWHARGNSILPIPATVIPKSASDLLSWICFLKIDSTRNPVKSDGLIFYANDLFNRSSPTMSRLLCFDIEVNESHLVTGAFIWLYKPLQNRLPTNVIFSCGLNKFFSILYLRFFENVLKYGLAHKTSNAQFLKWRELYAFQMGS